MSSKNEPEEKSMFRDMVVKVLESQVQPYYDSWDEAGIVPRELWQTFIHADQIIVLDHGRLDGIGTHQELLESSDTYREIVKSQYGEEGIA